MLKTILKKLNGHGDEAVAIEAALLQLDRDLEVAGAKIDELNIRRHQALLDDADDATLDKIEREIDRATVRMEKLTISEEPLRTRLTAVHAKKRKEAEAALIPAHRAARGEYCAALRAMVAARRKLDEIDHEACLALGEGRARLVMPACAYTGQLTAQFVEMWLNREEQEYALPMTPTLPTPVKAVQPVPVRTRLPHERAKATDSQRPVALFEPQPARQPAPRTPDDVAPLQPGETRVKVLRSGFSPADDRPAACYGQLVRMPHGAAKRAADAGAVEIIESANA